MAPHQLARAGDRGGPSRTVRRAGELRGELGQAGVLVQCPGALSARGCCGDCARCVVPCHKYGVCPLEACAWKPLEHLPARFPLLSHATFVTCDQQPGSDDHIGHPSEGRRSRAAAASPRPRLLAGVPWCRRVLPRALGRRATHPVSLCDSPGPGPSSVPCAAAGRAQRQSPEAFAGVLELRSSR